VLAEFQCVTGVQISELELFAVTDTNSRKTFLLPSFYELDPDQSQRSKEKPLPQNQMAILFHEAYWLVNPKASYDQVVAAEMSFQAIVDQPNNLMRQMDFLNRVGTRADGLKFALDHDLKTGALGDLLNPNDGMISLDALFGFAQCIGVGTCSDEALPHIYHLAQQRPNSLLLKRLILSLSTKKIQVLGGAHEECKSPTMHSSSGTRLDSVPQWAQCSLDTKNMSIQSDSEGSFNLICKLREPKPYCKTTIDITMAF